MLKTAEVAEFKELAGQDWTIAQAATGKLYLYHIHPADPSLSGLYTVLETTKKCRHCGKEPSPYVWVLYKTWLLKDLL